MAAERIHIVPHDQGWAIKREGVSKVESVHSTQKEAIDAGRDLSRESEVDLVVHRQDGTFRNVLTYTNDPMKTNGNGQKVETQDVYSVGSRVSWGALLAGASVALTMNAVLWLGGMALGITVSDKVGARTLTLVAALWMIASSLLSLFMGGYVVSRLTAGENHSEAVMYGVILWGFMFACSMFLASTGAATGMLFANLRPEGSYRDIYRESNMSQADLDRFEARLQQAREEAGALSSTTIAWLTFVGVVLSMGAAIGGSWLGAGPDFILVSRPRAVTAPPQVPATV